ncbi:AraC family transcriptional regulator ligand-binding domain-containing protein [Microbulbifer sp. SSSA008]|uniref:AraC family transcriptional regulator n=1 Tax=unclassified Microbulbifer TaxID=2619833 RepID=UPI002B2D31CD|nr:AraC family transcriptional regulator ligand-binding domain-containing protein [Microbulbifer sp. MKSA007]
MIKRAAKFLVPPSWKLILHDMNIDTALALAYAGLPADLLQREAVTLSPVEYFRFWCGIDRASKDRPLPLLLAEHLSAESFDPPIFASLCSANLNQALLRIQQYKPLIGPMELHLDITDEYTKLNLECYGSDGNIPEALGLSELIFYIRLARLGTREEIQPLELALPQLPEDQTPYREFFGCSIKQSDRVRICFSAQDAQKPFLTANAPMWDFFEGKLSQQLKDLDSEATMGERVGSVLMELLPAGESSVEAVSERLAISKRTLQRKLGEENQSFQTVLQGVRSSLADHYLAKSSLHLGEISFMLGFKEPNSFIRAYRGWKGMTPLQYRDSIH